MRDAPIRIDDEGTEIFQGPACSRCGTLTEEFGVEGMGWVRKCPACNHSEHLTGN